MRNLMLSSALVTVGVRAFDPGKAGWKMDGDKLALDSAGNPIYLKEDGSEQSVDGGTISRLNGEAKGYRERAEAAESKLKPFEGLDPAKAKAAIETVGKIDQKKLIDAGEVDKLRAEIAGQYTGQLEELKKTNGTLQSDIDGMRIQSVFTASEFVRDRVAVPLDMFQATFAKNFKIEDGKAVPYYADGNKVYSKKRMGEVADVDEAFELIIDTHPHKDAILRAAGNGGSGNGGNGGNRGGGRTMKRSAFEALLPNERSAAATAMGKGELQIVD